MIRSYEALIEINFDKKFYTSPDTLTATISINNLKLIKLEILVVEIQSFEQIAFIIQKPAHSIGTPSLY